ncbi:chemotaxis protein CheB [Desulforhopalus sp. IMCC35007]|uniref:chemotaxis protein CheB n=1 Tax=Desulforhopalus sp. IMCC35007 TaxID=2569543 RepID=UPI0010ADC38C|nr:chemotaxis protein CheB [Desulforhopalus sp. IMCC35007]TKB05968.1 chemotaxis protein CheR [Desulforhopalus sp. IMCC35007]
MAGKKEEQAQSATKSASSGKVQKKAAITGQLSVPCGPAPFPIVGIGASAGGLEAFESFFKAMPATPGIAFVLVAHLDPTHTSILPELIQNKTKMKVLQVTDNMKVQANHVYIIPPNKEMAILNGSLQLMEMLKPRGANLPIDSFLRSLAQDQGSNASCIILSGTGTDGTLGLRAIKGEAGMTMVQDEESAKYNGMPRSAIATGLVDYVLPADKMPEQLLKYVKHVTETSTSKVFDKDEKLQNGLKKIFILLRAGTGHDFSLYKKNTILRRIERRMHVHQLDDIEAYVRYLQESERERVVLFKELLIGVTSFFRDTKAFELLKKTYLPTLLKEKPEGYSVRIWVPGCSSGEEVYSIAMIIQECMEEMGHRFNIQIFGTDIDEEAINAARAGIYPDSISADISPERLKKFFTKDENHFKVKKLIREMVVFAQQNIIKDPPFTKLDMLSCRNLLIYFGPELQNIILPIFHYSLKNDGVLFLGSSESIGHANDLFKSLDSKWKIFQRISSGLSGRPSLNFPISGQVLQTVQTEDSEQPRPVEHAVNTLKLLKSMLAQSDMPPCVVIDDLANILYIHGRTGQFLEPAEGETNNNIFQMARPGLKIGLTNAINKTATSLRETEMKGLQIKDNGTFVSLNLIVRPLPDFQTGRHGMMLVIFDTGSPDVKKKGKTVLAKKAKNTDDIKMLEDELRYTKENLQTTIEELETSNEELKSTNEELQSTNEELQSTNEELETSKEELQSLNEESVTVNAELQSRIDELVKANDDIKNLLDATAIAVIFLDIDLTVRRFTPTVTEMFPLTKADIGRPIEHFASSLIDVNLQACSRQVLKDLGLQETTVKDTKGKMYRMRIRPYRTVNNVIDGVVITFEDITQSQQAAST